MTLTADVESVDVDESPPADEMLQAAIAAQQMELLAEMEQLASRAAEISRRAADVNRRLGVLGQVRELAEALALGASVEEAATVAPAAHQRIDLDEPDDAPALSGPLEVLDDDPDVEEPAQASAPDDVPGQAGGRASGATRWADKPNAEHLADAMRVLTATNRAASDADDGWLSVTSLCAHTNMTRNLCASRMKELIAEGRAEHNGKATTASRFRLCNPAAPTPSGPTPAEIAEARNLVDVAAQRETDAERIREDRPAPGISRRVQREMAAEQRRQDRQLGADTPEPAEDGKGTVDGQILSLLNASPPLSAGTIAARLSLSGHQILAAITRLKKANDIHCNDHREWELTR